jgi:hypothetical protein
VSNSALEIAGSSLVVSFFDIVGFLAVLIKPKMMTERSLLNSCGKTVACEAKRD